MAAKTDPEKQTDAIAKRVDEAVSVEQEQGFRGAEVDSTPNENYTAAGVTAEKPVPEASDDPAGARRAAANL